jgi:hypothetical protein
MIVAAGKNEFAKAGGFSQKGGLAADDAAYIRVSGPALPKAGKQAANTAWAPKARFVSGQGSTGAALGFGFAAPALVARAASLLLLWLPFLLIMGILALFPAPAKAQSINASLVGYRFECCPASGVNKQFLVLALVEHRNNVPNFNNIKYAKYQVSGDTIYLTYAKDSLTAMREGILGGKYTVGSPQVRDFQSAVKAEPVDGGWGEGTWRALFAYFGGLDKPLTVSLGNRKVQFFPLLKKDLSKAQISALAIAVENDAAGNNTIPTDIIRSLLGAAASSAIPTATAARVTSPAPPVSSPAMQPAASTESLTTDSASPLNPQPAQSNLLPDSARLVESAGEQSQVIRQILSNLDPDMQRAVATFVSSMQTQARQDLEKALEDDFQQEKTAWEKDRTNLQGQINAQQTRWDDLRQKAQADTDLHRALTEAGVDLEIEARHRQSLWNRMVTNWAESNIALKILYIVAAVLAAFLLLVLVFIVLVQKVWGAIYRRIKNSSKPNKKVKKPGREKVSPAHISQQIDTSYESLAKQIADLAKELAAVSTELATTRAQTAGLPQILQKDAAAGAEIKKISDSITNALSQNQEELKKLLEMLDTRLTKPGSGGQGSTGGAPEGQPGIKIAEITSLLEQVQKNIKASVLSSNKSIAETLGELKEHQIEPTYSAAKDILQHLEELKREVESIAASGRESSNPDKEKPTVMDTVRNIFDSE